MRIKIKFEAWEMPSKKAPAPSAPVEDESSGSHVYPQLHEAPQPLQPQIVTTQHVQAPQPVPPPGFVDAEAPPSYQDALASSVNPPYPGGPSTPGNVKMPQSNAIPMYPAPPYQPQMLNPSLIPTTPIVVTTTTTTVHPRGDCNFCQHGHVRNETDFCCLLCLIIIAVFTFPIGLLLLCCIPCTVRKRCNRCRRIY